jgi:hypothetical protein
MRSNSPGTLGLLGRNVSVYYIKSYFYRRMLFLSCLITSSSFF